jgi:hypothetical protein
MGDTEKQVSVDCKVIGAIEKRKITGVFENSPTINCPSNRYAYGVQSIQYDTLPSTLF